MDRKPRPLSDLRQKEVLAAFMLAHPDVRKGMWRAPAIDSLTEHADDAERLADLINGCRFEPDAYMLDGDELHFIEVEITHGMNRAKIEAYTWLRYNLDAINILFRVFVVNRYGHVNEIDFMPYYAELLRVP